MRHDMPWRAPRCMPLIPDPLRCISEPALINDAQHTLTTRRTVHDYDPSRPVPEDALARALECAVRAPNHKLTNPWRFTRIGPQAREGIAALGVRLKTDGRDLPPPLLEKIRKKFTGAPELLVVTQALDHDEHRRREDYAAVACAIQNLMLSLWSEGIGSKWSSGGVTTHDDTYALAKVPPGEEIVGFLWIGYPERDDCPTAPRRPVEEILRLVP